jgi:type I restriction enzyme, S subunit
MKNKKPATTQQPDEKPGLRPKLRFPEFRNAKEWKVKPFAGLFSIGSGRDHKHLSLGNIPVYGSGGYMRSVDEYLHDGESVCIGRKGTINNPMFLTGKFWTVDTLFYTHSFNQCLPKFVFSIFQNIDWLKHNEAGGVPSLSKTNIEKIETALPSLAEQQKIAECLSSLDELIAAQAQKLDALKTHKKGLMQQLFPREGETQPRLRFPEFRNAGEWKESTFGAAANFYNGRAYKQEELLESGKYTVLRVGNFFTNKNWYYSDLELDETKYCENGDLLYAWSASFGPRIWQGEKTIYHYHIWKVIEKLAIAKQFLFITLANETEKMKAKSSNGLGMLHITKGTIEGWRATFPSKPEQQLIADCLTSLDDLISAQTQKLDTLKTHKKGLMQQLFPSPEVLEA